MGRYATKAKRRVGCYVRRMHPKAAVRHERRIPPPPLDIKEFVPLMAMIVSLGALSIDAMLPAIHLMASDLGARAANDAQGIISSMFLGFAVGQIAYGPLSDAVGRKPAIFLGVGFFLVGCTLCVVAETYWALLAGRILQGIGAAATRVVSMALIRDQYAGERMARVMSLIMGVFVLVPAIAPALGQAVLAVSGWRTIFGLLAMQALAAVGWLAIRQPETLRRERRRPLSARGLGRDVREVFRHAEATGYTLAFACVFANVVGYLTAAPQIFRELFGVDRNFPLYFAMTAAAIGAGSFVNSLLVARYRARRVSLWALSALALQSGSFVLVCWASGGQPAFWQFIAYLVGAFFCIGPLMGNLNAMAMEPVGHVAGTAAATLGALSTLVSLVLGSSIGQAYSGTVYPLVGGFCVLSALALGVAWRTPAPAPCA